jgi:hypothetical protein
MPAPDETWLRCGVSPGMFDHELGVQGQQADGSAYSLFAPREAVDPAGQTLTRGQIVPGSVQVEIIERRGNLVCVQLPGETFQNGYFITVTADQLKARPRQGVGRP